MRITFDRESDVAYLSLVDRDLRAGEAVTQSDILPTPSGEGSLIIDFDADGRLLGIEVLSASSVLPAALLQTAQLGGHNNALGLPPRGPRLRCGRRGRGASCCRPERSNRRRSGREPAAQGAG